MTSIKRSSEPLGIEENEAKKVKVEEENPQRRPEEPNPRAKGIQEEDVGISQYISRSNNGFKGILKQRYYDFLVNEIDADGNVVNLTDEGVQNRLTRRKERRALEQKFKSEDNTAEKTEEKPLELKEDTPKPTFQLKPEHRIALLELFGEQDLSKVEDLLTSGNNMETSRSFDDKAQRTKIHQLLREAFEGKLETLTTDSNTFKIALTTRRSRQNKNLPKKTSRDKDDLSEGDFGLGPVKNFLTLTLYKENRETMEAASILCKYLRIPSKWVSYAGTKDRRGVTVQRLSIERMRVSRVNNLNKVLKGIKIGSFGYSDVRLGLGDLQGNEFVITIKDVEHYDKTRSLEEVLQESFESLENNGFINYFGMQRFGTFSISTHDVGIKLLLGDWKGAVELLLSEQELVTPDSIEARKIWSETRDPSQTLAKMPRRCSAEYLILEALTKNQLKQGGDYNDNVYFQAIMKIPRNLRIMYGHAYQSYVWNCVASKRIELFGLSIVEGDLILDNSENVPKPAEEMDGEAFEEDVKESKFIRARPITLEEIASKAYSIFDVVLPTPGFDVVYPSNPQLRQVYEQVMENDGLEPYKMSRRVREFSLAGSYRKLLGRASNLEYHIRKYDSNEQTLVKTDLDIVKLKQDFQKLKVDELLKDKELLSEKEIEDKIEEIMNSTDFPEFPKIEKGDENGSKTAVIVKMRLGVSAYATMLLRELMKKDTSRRGDVCDVVVE